MAQEKFKDMMEFFNQIKKPRLCKKTNKYGGEVVRVNQNARTKLQQMCAVTKLTKRSLLSYAVYLLYEEFEKWRKGELESKFGYDEEEVEHATSK